MKFGKKQILIGAALLGAGYLVYRFYKKPASTTKSAEELAAAAAEASAAADEADAAEDAAIAAAAATGAVTTESFLGRGKKKKQHLGTRKERIAKSYVALLKKGLDPLSVQAELTKRIKGNKTSKKEQAAALAELADIASTPKSTLIEVAEARTVGGGDGFMSQSFMM